MSSTWNLELSGEAIDPAHVARTLVPLVRPDLAGDGDLGAATDGYVVAPSGLLVDVWEPGRRQRVCVTSAAPSPARAAASDVGPAVVPGGVPDSVPGGVLNTVPVTVPDAADGGAASAIPDDGAVATATTEFHFDAPLTVTFQLGRAPQAAFRHERGDEERRQARDIVRIATGLLTRLPGPAVLAEEGVVRLLRWDRRFLINAEVAWEPDLLSLVPEPREWHALTLD